MLTRSTVREFFLNFSVLGSWSKLTMMRCEINLLFPTFKKAGVYFISFLRWFLNDRLVVRTGTSPFRFLFIFYFRGSKRRDIARARETQTPSIISRRDERESRFSARYTAGIVVGRDYLASSYQIIIGRLKRILSSRRGFIVRRDLSNLAPIIVISFLCVL